MPVHDRIGRISSDQVCKAIVRKCRVERRIVGHHDHFVALFPHLAHRVETERQAQKLPFGDLDVLFRRRADRPKAAAADKQLAAAYAVVLNGMHPFGQRLSDLADRAPPIVVVATQDKLDPGQLPHLGDVGQSLVQRHCPREIAGKQDDVVGAHFGAPIVAYLVPMPFPAGTENVHRL